MERCGDVRAVSYRKGPAGELEFVIDEDVLKDRPDPFGIVYEGLDVLAVTVEITDLGLTVQIDGKNKSRRQNGEDKCVD